jgi:hypothetical protein
MHLGLVAVKAPLARLVDVFAKVWPELEIVASKTGFRDAGGVLTWVKENEHFVSSRGATPENPGTLCLLFAQDGPWAIMMDSSCTLAGDEEALPRLGELCQGTLLSFVVESSGGCAYFSHYESGELRRSISNDGAEVEFEGEALAQEEGIDTSGYYMDETEALMRAFGLSAVESLPDPATTTAIAVADRTDYSQFRRAPAGGQARAQKPWWKFW